MPLVYSLQFAFSKIIPDKRPDKKANINDQKPFQRTKYNYAETFGGKKQAIEKSKIKIEVCYSKELFDGTK